MNLNVLYCFSISSSPDDDVTTHHIKVMPPDFTGIEWTEKLYNLGESIDAEKMRSLKVNIEGPYGTPLACYKYRQVTAYSYTRYVHLLVNDSIFSGKFFWLREE